MHVLLVEDNPGDVRLLQVMLAEAGAARFTVTQAGQLSIGLQRLGEGRAQVVLLDLSLPDSQGLDTLVRMHAEAKGVPIVVLTGLEDEALGIKLVQVGAQDYLVKGQITGPLLVRALHYAIERKRTEALQAGQNRVLDLLTTGSPIAEVLDTLARVVEEQVRGIRCSILLVNEDGTRLRRGAAPSLPEDFSHAVDGLAIGPQAGSCGTAAYRRQTVIVEDIATDPRWGDFSTMAVERGLRAAWSSPISSTDGQVLGTFCLYCEDARGPSGLERALMETGARMAGIVIERKRADEERTRLAHDRLLLLESTGEGIYGIDVQGRCTFVNQSAAKMLGYDPAELLGKDMHALIHHHRSDGSPYPVGECPIYRAFQIGQGCRVDGEVLWRRDGRAFPADYSSSPIRAGGAIKGAVVTFTDITERKRAEQALQESRSALQHSHEELRALAAQLLTVQEEERRRISRNLHDDLNQKLAMLAVEAESLAQHLPRTPALIIDRLQTLRNRVVDLTEDVRRLAYQLHPSILDHLGLAVALQSYVDDFAKRERIKVTFTHKKLPQSLPQDIASCLYRVAQECLRNVAKHARSIRVTITLAASETGLLLSIKDYGVGFAPDAVKQQGGGLGILSMQERVRLVKGELAVTSRPGHGARIDVSVPLPEGAS